MKFLISIFILFAFSASAEELSSMELEESIRAGKLHAQFYPLHKTGLLPPYYPVERFVDKDSLNPLKAILQSVFKQLLHVKSFDEVFKWIGLHNYPSEEEQGVYAVPYPNNQKPKHRMGLTLVERNTAVGFTLGCVECHSGNLFGKTVLGLTNRFPRANETFVRVKNIVPYLNPVLFQIFNNATNKEADLIREAKRNIKSVGIKRPLALGLDTSLSQVSLSLARRNPDDIASKNKYFQTNPREDYLENHRADSKPSVWWNVKYKNRWLSDGSVISGNPIITNILWNEIGRGSDLVELEDWLDQNKVIVRDLTNAVFSIQAPKITDFFAEERIDIQRAMNGEQVFLRTCSRCHGVYEKNWQSSEPLKTIQVRYHGQTPVIDVGTDANRYLGIKTLEQLNQLRISKKHDTVIQAQKGYVPPPLVGIWARWPYLHNNSIPNLCVLLTRSENRPKNYYSGEANNPNTDFDFDCNGYPIGNSTPANWKSKEHFYDTTKIGLSNFGHDEGIFLKNGEELLTSQEKSDLILFLQTL